MHKWLIYSILNCIRYSFLSVVLRFIKFNKTKQKMHLKETL